MDWDSDGLCQVSSRHFDVEKTLLVREVGRCSETDIYCVFLMGPKVVEDKSILDARRANEMKVGFLRLGDRCMMTDDAFESLRCQSAMQSEEFY